MATLEIFDFDWTLFRSPSPPEREPEKSWLASPESLLPPYVPLRPGSEWWIEDVVREVRAAQNRRGTIVAVITARRANASDRIYELLAQKNISPDYFVYRSSAFHRDKDKNHFKRMSLIKILRDNPTIDSIIAWEDFQDHLDDYEDISIKKNIMFDGNLVTEPGGMHYNG